MAELALVQGIDVLNGRARVARTVLLAFIAISAVDAIATLGELGGALDPNSDDLSMAGGMAALIHLGNLLMLIAGVITVAMWIHRAHANLRAAGVEGLEFSPGWAVGWYFVPIANLFKPFQAMRELWANSLARPDSFGQEADPVLRLWWGAWIVGNILSNVSARMVLSGGAKSAATGNVVDIVSTVVLAAAGWFLIRIIDTITTAQRSGTTLAQAFA